MKVSELKSILEREDDNLDVMILINLPYATVGSRPMVGIESVYGGFDWESGRLICKPTEGLTPTCSPGRRRWKSKATSTSE